MQKNAKRVAVVILNWNGKKFLELFLPRVIEYSKEVAKIIVADNASSDDSVDFLKSTFSEVEIIQNKTNGGFAKGYNDALKQVEAEYYILLNSDIEVTPNWINPIIELMDANAEIAACQPKILSYYHRDTFEYAGAAGGFIDAYGYPFCRGRIFQHVEKDEKQYDDVAEVFWATGACMFVRAQLYHQLQGLDNDFFAHMEEIDFCWRLKNAGYKIYYSPQSVVYHVGGGTLPKKNWRKTYLNFRNNLVLLYKNLPTSRLFPVFAMRAPLDGIAAIKFLFSGGIKDFLAVGRAYASFYLKIHKHLLKRRRIRHHKVSKIYKRNIVFLHYLKKVKLFSQLKAKDFS